MHVDDIVRDRRVSKKGFRGTKLSRHGCKRHNVVAKEAFLRAAHRCRYCPPGSRGALFANVQTAKYGCCSLYIMSASNRVPAANRLLAALPGKDYQRLLTGFEPVTLSFGEVLYEPEKPIRHVYFPSDALVSLLTPIEGHKAPEIGLVGREGMLGIPVALGISKSPARALVLGTGTALRMTAERCRSEYGKFETFHSELNRYIHQRIVQITQTAACNRFHPVEDRLARWLLMMRDRMETNHFYLTQELLGNMLGVLRVAVTKAAGALRRRKLISYRRGNISILDEKGLEEASCRCYKIVKDTNEGHRSAVPR